MVQPETGDPRILIADREDRLPGGGFAGRVCRNGTGSGLDDLRNEREGIGEEALDRAPRQRIAAKQERLPKPEVVHP